jgi:16S rRNA (guanine(966)-N(2))-methyltransferase RsmD
MGFINITSGKFRGRRIKTPEGAETRPLLARVRKSLADILRPDIGGSHVLDLFGGSGAIALELISNGAGSAVIVDLSAVAAELISQNIMQLGVESEVEVIRSDFAEALKTIAARGCKFEVIIVAPPYGEGLQQKAVDLLAGADILHENGLIVVQREKQEPGTTCPESYEHVRMKKYGRTVFEFFRLFREE